ncbi:uncharacterized protein LOC130640652 [Hydractinia symbiolongicarpus]|uniref:uncharacterized protein LOC130640652 n=1 Tax=Hydractinia symbiolongicarpus TaxID=13093 RepID=UPI00254AA51D|nr:uncharacterized protein LOC130640652 [Hydractinia symbiolongicarpus]
MASFTLQRLSIALNVIFFVLLVVMMIYYETRRDSRNLKFPQRHQFLYSVFKKDDNIESTTSLPKRSIKLPPTSTNLPQSLTNPTLSGFNVTNNDTKNMASFITAVGCSNCVTAEEDFFQFSTFLQGTNMKGNELKKNIEVLRCYFADILPDNKLDDKSTAACSNHQGTTFTFRDQVLFKSIRNYNNNDTISLSQISQLLQQFYKSLNLMEAYEKDVLKNKTRVAFPEQISKIRKGLVKFTADMRLIRKNLLTCECIFNPFYEKKIGQVVLEFDDPIFTQLNTSIVEKELAVMKQLEMTFQLVKEILGHRRRCLR